MTGATNSQPDLGGGRTLPKIGASMSAATNHREPPKVPNHEMIRVIGRGSYGEIWMARSQLGVLRAVKIVDRRNFESDKAFQREFEGMARFEPISREHTGFVDILHVGLDDHGGFFYYVMELADDHLTGLQVDERRYVPKTLKSELSRRSRLLADEVIALGISLTEALAALHREELVHRDIKLANVIFLGGRPKIADIGLVAASGQDSFVGTEGYVPPEGQGTAQGDIFSLGKVLYELAMGKDRMDFPALNTQIDKLPDRETLLRINDVVLRACATNLVDRYARAEQMHEDLIRIRDGRPLIHLGRRRWPWIAGAVAIIAAGAFGGTYLRMKNARGAVTIETDPPDAMVVVNGRMIRSPARYDKLPIGKTNARIMLPGYEPVDQPLTVDADSEMVLPMIKLARSTGSLAINSRPADAEFTLNDAHGPVRSGKLPTALNGLPTGPYLLEAKYDGRVKSSQVEIKRSETTTMEIEFAKGQLHVESQPPGAEILVDGKSSGQAPLNLELADGPHQIVAKYRHWPQQNQSVTVDPQSPGEAVFEFVPGRVKIASAPGGATVYADGREVGHTPALLEDLEPGPVHYELRLPGYQPLALNGEVKPGEQTLIGGFFTKRAGPMFGQPWENSLGMKFVPVGNVLMGIWPVRVRDYAAFSQAAFRTLPKPDFAQDDFHPVVLVNVEDTRAFCEWLTQTERAAGQLTEGQSYRLPKDVEWSTAAGLADEGRSNPEERDGKIRDYAWGKHWPPPANSGNFADNSLRRTGQPAIAGYIDGYSQTSPVGSFPPNAAGLFDMNGNVWQWVLEPYNPTSRWGVMRGGCWATEKKAELTLSYRNVVDPAGREVIYGFRVVIANDSAPH